MGVMQRSMQKLQPRDKTDIWIQQAEKKRRTRGGRKRSSGKRPEGATKSGFAHVVKVRTVIAVTVAFARWDREGKRMADRIRQDVRRGLEALCAVVGERPNADFQVGPTRLELVYDLSPCLGLTEAKAMEALRNCGAQVLGVKIATKTAAATTVSASSPELPKQATSGEVERLQAEVARLRKENDLLMASIVEAGKRWKELTGTDP